jgi:tetratricopeptide (TPR) repeat protein
MRNRAKPTAAVVVCMLVLSARSISQSPSRAADVQSLLREASALIPNIDKTQQSSAASNIAGQQARSGDLAGALSTVQAMPDSQDRIIATRIVASALAWQGNAPLALELIRNSAAGDAQGQAYGYLFVAEQLAGKHAFEEAARVAALIEEGPAFSGRTNLFTGALMRIRAKIWEAGDRDGSAKLLNTALDAVQSERENPSDPEFAESTPAQLYGGIASELSREGDREDALAVMERLYGLVLQSSREKQAVLGALADAQASFGDFQAAACTVAQMTPGQQRDGAMMIITMERTRQGDPEGAVDEAVGLSLEEWRNGSLRSIVGALSASGNYARALSVIDLIQTPGERAYALAELALEQAEKDDPTAAQTVEMARGAALGAGSETKPFVFEFIAVTRGMLGDFTGAEEMIASMEDQSKVWPLWNLSEMLVRAGKESEAVSLAESQTAPHAKAYALLGTATALLDKQREASRRGSAGK